MTISTRQYRRYLDLLEVSQGRAAKMLGISPRQSRRYALDETPVPEPVNIVLRLMLKHGFTPEDIEAVRKEKVA